LGARGAWGSRTGVGWRPSGAVIGRSRRARLRPGDPEARLELFEPALGRAQAAGHVGQVLLRGEEPLGLEHWHGGAAKSTIAGGHVPVGTPPRTQHPPRARPEEGRRGPLPPRGDAPGPPAPARKTPPRPRGR